MKSKSNNASKIHVTSYILILSRHIDNIIGHDLLAGKDLTEYGSVLEEDKWLPLSYVPRLRENGKSTKIASPVIYFRWHTPKDLTLPFIDAFKHALAERKLTSEKK